MIELNICEINNIYGGKLPCSAMAVVGSFFGGMGGFAISTAAAIDYLYANAVLVPRRPINLDLRPIGILKSIGIGSSVGYASGYGMCEAINELL